VVASLWDVEDAATQRLMAAFHRQVAAGGNPAEALRDAQLELLRSDDRALRRPSAWAAFFAAGHWMDDTPETRP